jgi:hypothetical protein
MAGLTRDNKLLDALPLIGALAADTGAGPMAEGNAAPEAPVNQTARYRRG